ncbi:response regulator transcription factor [candidate division KSB1 bacterium]|nr:response regulator transcription factor [candidate division KSB1 bacterium]
MAETTATAELIKIAVIDDDANVRNGLWWLLNHVIGLRCVGAYSSCAEFMAQSTLSPEVLLLDLALPGMSGLAGIPLILGKYPALRILMHSNFDDEEKILQARRAGAAGYIFKNASAPQLHDAILAVHRGEKIWPAGIESASTNATTFSFLRYLTQKLHAVFKLH